MDLTKMTLEEIERAKEFNDWWQNSSLTPEERKMLGAKYFSYDFDDYGIPREVVKGNTLDVDIEEFEPVKTGEKKVVEAGFKLSEIGLFIEINLELFLAKQ